MNCLLRYYCLFRQKLLCPLAFCRNDGSISGCELDYGRSGASHSEWKRLRCFLDKNLPLHRAPVIESFHLRLYRPCLKPKDIKLWLVIAVFHRVRELAIFYDSYPAKPNILPSNLFTCKSLVILKLDGEILLDVPRMVYLPSLKSLKLENGRFFNDETLRRLLSNCPILEDLVVNLSDDGTTGKLTVASPSLQSLSILRPCGHDIDGFVIETPSLTHFKLTDYNIKSPYCLIENMPNLIEAHVEVDFRDIKSLIGSITSVKRLAICSEVVYDEGFVFNQLEHMELCICREDSSIQLVPLLKASSNLQGLDLFYMDGHIANYSFYWNQPSIVPECMLSSLQTLKWSGYYGEPDERDVVVYILKHAVHLKTATITSWGSEFPKFDMLKELALSSRASATCQLIFDCICTPTTSGLSSDSGSRASKFT